MGLMLGCLSVCLAWLGLGSTRVFRSWWNDWRGRWRVVYELGPMTGFGTSEIEDRRFFGWKSERFGM